MTRTVIMALIGALYSHPVAHVYRLRSASRVGRSDLGVNRKRMARISARRALPPTTSN